MRSAIENLEAEILLLRQDLNLDDEFGSPPPTQYMHAAPAPATDSAAESEAMEKLREAEDLRDALNEDLCDQGPPSGIWCCVEYSVGQWI